MIMKYDKMVAITQAESQRKMNIAKNTISDMLKNMERITVAELVKRTGLSRGFFYKNELIRREMDDAIHRQEAIFKNRHPVAMDRKLENSVIDVKNKSVEEVLEMLFVGKNIRYRVEGDREVSHRHRYIRLFRTAVFRSTPVCC